MKRPVLSIGTSGNALIEIRPYTKKDWKEVSKLYQECFKHPFTVEMLSARLNSAITTWVAVNGDPESENSIVAYLLLDSDRGIPYLSQVAVTKSQRKLGIATSLIRYCEEQLTGAGVGSWWLQVDASNPSQKLYFDLGFRVTGFNSNMYGIGKAGLEMSKVLNS